ncbi:MAG: hypothetical protein CMF74_07770 [Maricaulis sp.]|jgi:hypothetical protein|nr:hypothetical protein [Maricaulis sp.]HAQ35844.1 hypothetical protein [Alphaproteobacteria bacterium]|tara:strand:- start:643 stop:1332 length:690 start_codon:yes stop_codon:yes gene_type:complete
MLRTYILAGLAAATVSAGALAQSDDGTRTPQLIHAPLPDGGVNIFVVGQDAFGDMFQEVSLLHGLERERDAEVAARIWEERDNTPPLFLLEAARRYATIAPEQALYTYFLARMRIIYDARRCVDSSALQTVELVDQLAQADIAPLMADAEMVHAQLSAVYSSGDAFTSTTSPWWICSSGDSAFYAAQNDASLTRNEWLKLESQWPAIRDAMNQNMLANIQAFATAIAEQ